MTDLEKLEALPRDEKSALLALFAGARGNLKMFVRGDTGQELRPFFGKAECEWVPFRPFWRDKMPSYGWTTFSESEPRLALGMVEGSTVTDVEIRVTDAGHDVREAYWAALDAKIVARRGEVA